MIYDFSEIKEDYLNKEMSKEQLERLCVKMEEAKLEERKEMKKRRRSQLSAVAAAFLAAFVILPNTSAEVAMAMEKIPLIGNLVEVVTFRDYEYASEDKNADIQIPELKPGEAGADGQAHGNLEQAAGEINAEIQQIADELQAEFEERLEGEGYLDVTVTSEVLTATEEYFTLKLLCYESQASGYQLNYYYTVDLTTGQRLALSELFMEGTDYITPISENIKEQMRTKMAEDEMNMYWLDDEIEELNFTAIKADQSFYIDENNNIVISFNEGDVAPMYMGVVEFTIPNEVISDIRVY